MVNDFKRYCRLLTVVCGLFILNYNLHAQDFKKQFKQAKDFFADEKYSEAMDAFRPLMIYDKENPYPEYANFYYALSAQRLGYINSAKESFLQTKNIYPNWEQLDEVNYWLVKIYYEQREYFHAINMAKQIKNSSMTSDLMAMKRTALSKVKDVETLKMLREENRDDTEVNRALAINIGLQTAFSTDSLLLDSIVNQFKWKKKDFVVIKNQPVYKDKYKIALLFPLRTSTLDASPGKKKSQFVLDLYQGMKQANDSLLHEGIKLDLLAYDTEHDSSVVKNILGYNELKSVDLIVGPLFPDDAKPVQEFSRKNQINLVVNPLSPNIDLVGENPQAFLLQPSYKTIGEKSAELIAAKTKNKKCFVYWGNTPKDTTMAFAFMRKALKLGVNIVHFEGVSAETSGNIIEALATPTEFDDLKNPIQFSLKLDSIGSVFVASDDALIYTKAINSVEARGDSVLLVGQESWLEDNSVDLGKFEKIKIAFASPNFTSINQKPYLYFRKKYLSEHGVLPGAYAQKGFESLMILGRALKKYGVYFQEGVQKNEVPGALTLGYQMLPAHDNGKMAFVSFKRGKLEMIGNH